MLPDRVSVIEHRTPDLQVRCPTDCATRPGSVSKYVYSKQYIYVQKFVRCQLHNCVITPMYIMTVLTCLCSLRFNTFLGRFQRAR